ncbi:histidine kinase [Dictyobacter alpinus]|uniref:histidine kinase n=1 Tax=Dictyobacter alpinus TaxID=2014873 RepID=A0A402BK84_9CHLR|nr:ATP-binding protein [Dictyobacter alpinus]GCE31752.1 histidine kinase [Dictyobacter alpinus]
MLKILERKITLQLLVFYGLFVIPLVLGGAELYFFQYDALQQNAQQADVSLAQALAQDVQTYVQGSVKEAQELAQSPAATQLMPTQLSAQFSISKCIHPEIGQYRIYAATGRLLLTYPQPSLNKTQNFNALAGLQRLQNSSEAFLLMGQSDQASKSYTVAIAAPIRRGQHQLAGMIVLTLLQQQLKPHLLAVQQQFKKNGEMRIWIMDSQGTAIVNTQSTASNISLIQRIPGLSNALHGNVGNVVARDEQREWLYSYVPMPETNWVVAVGRPLDDTFATVISFQHSLIIALIMLLVGASVFWFVMHGWVVAPLSRLAQAATMIKPDQARKVTNHRLLVREKSRQDEIGRLVNAFSEMEDEIHTLFRKSDEQSYTRLQTLDALLCSMDEGVLLEDPAGEVVYANHHFTRFVGMSAPTISQDTFQSKHLTERMDALVEKPEAYLEALHQAESGSGPQVIEFQVHGYYNQLGQLVPVRRHIRMRLFQVRDMSDRVIGRGKIMNDVTRQNEAEQVKKNLLAIVSHELRTPLTTIKGYATSLLETDIELDEAMQREFLQRIVGEGDRMAELVTSLLEMSQLEAGTLKLSPSLCRLDILLTRVIENVENGHLQIRLAVPAEVPVIYLDQRRIEMVLRNLLENAQRYAGGESEVTIKVCYTHEPEENGIRLSLEDNGPGLPVNLTERIFDSFYQVDGGRARSSSGVGLGLAICRGFVEAHGGRIWAENRSNGATGAIFHIWLPARLLHVPNSPASPFKLEEAF